MEPLPESLPLEPAHDLHHADIAGNLEQRRQIDDPIGPPIGIEDRPATNAELADVIDRGIGIDRLFLQGQGEVDRLEGGPRFIEILHRPFAEQTRVVFPKTVGVVTGAGGKGQYFAVAGIHHQGGATLGVPLLHLTGKGLLGHLLQPGIQGELQTQIVAVEGTGLQPIGQGGSVGAAAHGHGAFLAPKFAITALFESRLGHPLQIEEADHIGEKGSLGIDALGIGLEVEAADAQGPNPLGGFRIQAGGQLDTAAPVPKAFEQILLGQGQDLGQAGGHIGHGTHPLGRIARKIEIARMGPEHETLFIKGHQTSGAIDDRAADPDRFGGVGLDLPGFGPQPIAIYQLQPGQTETQPCQSRNQDQKHQDQPVTGLGWLGPDAGMTGPGCGSALADAAQLRTASPPGGMAPGGGTCHQYPAGTGPILKRARRPGLKTAESPGAAK